ncbi:MAG: phosphoribosylformylglycinamidine synthase subunit PurQ [Saprospiraceae bacterium]|nr:phosphoribosylformylglycinamidine synthase subunit PurQ [Saprospiraceae bacterium]
MKFGVVTFPGSNCDHDMLYMCGQVMQREAIPLWHKDTSLDAFDLNDCIILPGGFSFGDYLRCGALARYSPIMQSVIEFANNGGYVVGICNGFQILCESGLLPGVLLRNTNQKFICQNTYLLPDNQDSPMTSRLDPKQALKIPIAHAEGRFHADEATLDQLENNNQVLFRYCSADGVVTEKHNPNGALRNIAGISNAARNVMGMMPHPERAAESDLHNSDGFRIFDSLIQSIETEVLIS